MSIWKQARGQLATSFRTELHQTALPLLRIRWPYMRLCRDLQHLDKCGIDLVAPADEGPFDCVVQCKGFDGHGGLDKSHVDQVFDSIDTFERSGYRADTYVLLHTKDARSTAEEARIAARLDRLVAGAQIARYFVWNRQTFISDCIEQMTQLLSRQLQEDAREQAEAQARFFRFSKIRITPVPARQQNWQINPASGADSLGRSKYLSLDGAAVLQRAHKMRFSCLLGSFGVGKTTLALQAASEAASPQWQLIYAPARLISEIHPSQGTSLVHRQVLQAGDLLQGIPEDAALALTPYAADTLRSMMQNPDLTIVLCIDGLDESPALDNAAAMVSFVNALGELRCPILLTTRREHFDATFGNFSQAANQLSAKGGFKRNARIYELLPWTDGEVRRLIQDARVAATSDERPGLDRLASDLDSDLLSRDLDDLYRHPLFLQMLLDASSRSTTGLSSYRHLIPTWAQGKIERDLSVGRRAAVLSSDSIATTAAVFRWMEAAAARMLDAGTTPAILHDDIKMSTLTELAGRDPTLAKFTETDLLTTSLMVPTARRSLRPLRARFFHRMFQEYFTARASLTLDLAPESLPDSVRRWLAMARADLD